MSSKTYVQNVLATAATNEEKAECLALEIAWLVDKQGQLALSHEECVKMADEAMGKYRALQADLLLGKGNFSEVKDAYLRACWLDEQVVRYIEEVEYVDQALTDCQKELSQLFDILELDWLLGC